ncbi:MAG: hypothetical protein ACREGA_02055 [Candidatus Saccharimonadales bacterium]
MPYVSQGVGTGEIQVNLRTIGVAASDERSLQATIRGLTDTDSKSVEIKDGWLQCRIKAGRLQSPKLDKVLATLEAKIIGICQHKADNPGRGLERRAGTNKDRFKNDPRLATKV